MNNQDKYDKALLVISKLVMRFLMGLIVFCLIFGSLDLLIIIIKDLFVPPVLLIEISTLFTTFDLILTIAIGYELFKALHIIINSDKIPALQIVQIAIIAIANKIITTNVKETETKLATSWWGLHLPFTIGIMDAIKDDVTFIDANEEAYYYTSASEFFQVRNTLKNDGRALVPPALHQKYASKYSIGHAISADYVCGNWANVITFPFRLSGQGKMLTPQQQALWFEHNAYYSLSTSDEYAWLYTEKSNWWTGDNVPKGFADALLRAKKKVANGEPLGFNVEDMLKTAQIKAEKFQPEKK